METALTKVEVDNSNHELDLINRNRAIDILPPEMLQSIYKFLPFTDLLACRGVSKMWMSAASDPVRKRGNAIPLGGGDLHTDKRENALKNLVDCVNATGAAGCDFPVDKFELSFEDCDQSKVRQLLHDVSSFASELTFHFSPEAFSMIRDAFLIDGDNLPTNFAKLKFLGVEIMGAGHYQNLPVSQNSEIVDVDMKILEFIRRIIEKAPQLETMSLGVFGIFTLARAKIPRSVDGFGLRNKMNLLSTLRLEASFPPPAPLDWEALSGLGLKLKHLKVSRMENAGDGAGLKLFLESQADTLLTLVLETSGPWGSPQPISVNLPCLSVLDKLKIENRYHSKHPIHFPTICYKTQLPALKELCLLKCDGAWKDFIKGNNEMTPSLTLVKLNLPWGWGLLDEDEAVIQQVATLFPNLSKLGLPMENLYVARAVYTHLSWIEELTLFERKFGCCLLDQIITGVPEMDWQACSRAKAPPSRFWYWTFANFEFERPSYIKKSLASLKNLKLLKIETDGTDEKCAGLQFNEISGHVVKRLENLECIDFGIRLFPPLIPPVLKNELRKHVAFIYRPPLHRRSATDMVDRRCFQNSTDDYDSDDVVD